MALTIDPDNAVLDPEEAIATFADCLGRSDVSGTFDSYQYCVQNGRQVLLGHHNPKVGDITIPKTPFELSTDGSINVVFVSKQDRGNRHANTWEELRGFLNDGWVIGTMRYPGVKICFVDKSRNFRREADRVFVLR